MRNFKVLLHCGLLTLLFVLTDCGTDDGLRDAPILAGQIDGSEWKNKFGNAYRDNSERMYNITYFSDEEVSDEACTIAATGFRYLTISLPTETGSYNLPFNGASMRFHLGGSLNTLEATSGFVEITQILGNQISGYLQARFDDANSVEGQFRLKICN